MVGGFNRADSVRRVLGSWGIDDADGATAYRIVGFGEVVVRGKAHPDDMKAKVIAALLLGASVMEIARDLQIPHNTISQYKSKLGGGQLDELRRKKGERLDELVYAYMVKSFDSLQEQMKVAGNAEYLQKQPAGDLATLHGVMADKLVRLLEATTRAGQKQLPENV